MITRKNKTRKNKTRKNKTRKNKTHINTQIDSVYWINLNRSKERKKIMHNVLKDPIFDKMKKHRVEAFDGKKPSFDNYLTNFTNIKIKNEKVSLIEYACFLSHIKAIQEFVKSGDDIALIFEDDISLKFKKYWKTDLETCILNAPKDWEILQLFYFMDKRKTLLKNTYTFHGKKRIFSALAYIINKKGATRFLNNLIKNEKITLDAKVLPISDIYLYDKIKTYVYKYPFFSPISKESTIHQSHIKGHIESAALMEELLKNE